MICLLLLLSQVMLPSYSYALGSAYIAAVDKAFPVSLGFLAVSLLSLFIVKKLWPQVPIQLLIIAAVFIFAIPFPAVFLTSLERYARYEVSHQHLTINFIEEAAAEGGPERLASLLKEGADPNVIVHGRTALCEVARVGSLEKARLLLNRGADIEIRNGTGETPLIIAATYGNAEMVHFLLDHKADVEAKDSEGRTALMEAVIQKRPDIVKILLNAGAYVDAINKWGETALMEAALRGRTDYIPLLLETGARINAQDNRGRTALYDSILCCFPETAQLLLNMGADVSIRDKDGCSAECLASSSNNRELTNLFSGYSMSK